ncbi:hypothetical protein J437_LFUL002135 [Ladona fulva]|uniref:Uncharacterized protein n=1 Tax=Ladona fulva TaxID=123851 RepID=A0A8K0NU69_LADFU|nr:hypothetical protein J437_LFUL002135 [Ladona fulva]
MHAPPTAFARMARALINGMWAFVPFLDVHAFLRYARYLMGDKVKEEEDKKAIKGYYGDGVEIRGHGGPYSRFLFTLQVFFLETLLGNAIIAFFLRPYLNLQMSLAIFLAHRFPFLTFTHSKVY